MEVLEFKDVEFFKEFEQVWFNSAKGFDNDKEKVFLQVLSGGNVKIFSSQILDHRVYYVFFDNKFAYTVSEKDPGFKKFIEHAIIGSVHSVKNSKEYKEEVSIEW